MKKLIAFTLIAFGIYFSATHNVRLEIKPSTAHAETCDPNCAPPQE